MNETTNNEFLFSKTVTIGAPASVVWDVLTVPELMQQWMSETPIDIITSWEPGTPFLIRGRHYKMRFENRGTVLQFVPHELLEYSHLSSISRLKDAPENYTILRFRLSPSGDKTVLTLSMRNFPTEVIYRHLAFYWNVTLEKIKQQAAEH